MDTKHTNQLDHEAAMELLPWHVNASLSDELNQQVQAHVEACEECRTEKAFLANATFAANADEPPYGQADEQFKGLMNRIDAEERTGDQINVTTRPRWVELLSGLIPVSSWARVTAVAAMVVVGVTAGLVTQQTLKEEVNWNYKVLAGVKEPLILSVQLNTEVEESFIRGLVSSTVDRFDVEKKSARRFLVYLPQDTVAGDITAVLKVLTAHEKIQRVEIVAAVEQGK